MAETKHIKGGSCPQRGHHNPNSINALNLHRNNRKGVLLTEEHKKKIVPTGRTHSLETRMKMSLAQIGKPKITRLDKHPNWRGGKSFEVYPQQFNKQTKERVRVRDNFKCQECGVPELECYEKLHVHHIDYNKHNCVESNLISLCRTCHVKTNFNRVMWQEHFVQKVEAICG